VKDERVDVTLLRALTQLSGLSRRKAFDAIRHGRVSVAGRTVTDPSAHWPGGTLVLDGRGLDLRPTEHVYLMLNKPAGVITTAADTHGRETVLDVLPVELRLPGLHTVGRLDKDTTGLLLLTNDGNLTFRLTHPSNEVEKEYWLRSKPRLTEGDLERLRAGIEIDGVVRRPVEVRPLPRESGYDASITLREGRKRQVRRMVEAVGARVTGLARVREGPLLLGGLAEGEVRRLTKDELQALSAAPRGPAPDRGPSRVAKSPSRRSALRR
jgi:23S rRNA pseudouridine2605 synthase